MDENMNNNISPETISEFIDKILQTDDPSVVGLKKILKKKDVDDKASPFKEMPLSDFESGNSILPSKKKLSEDEKHVLQLERENLKLKSEIKKLKESFENEIKTAEEKKYNEGFAAGKKEGYDIAKKEFDLAFDDMEKNNSEIISSLKKSFVTYVKEYENIILKLVFAVAKKVIKKSVDVDYDIVREIIKDSLKHIADDEKFIIVVSQEDYDYVVQNRNMWQELESGEKITIETSSRVQKGGCIIKSESGNIDNRLETRFEEIKNHIEKIWTDVFKKSEDEALMKINSQISDGASQDAAQL